MADEALNNLELGLKELIADVGGVELEKVKSEANFWEDLGFDSIKGIEITVAIEKKYKIRIKDEQVPQITTVAKAIEIVREALESKS